MGLVEALNERVGRGAVRMIPPPQSALRLREVVASPEHSLQQTVAAVMLDPMLAAVVLRLANSTEFIRLGPTTNLSSAVQRVGDAALAKLAFAALLTSDAATPGPLRQVRRALLQRALVAAHACERLAPTFDADGQSAFLAGLLREVGTLVALNTLELLVAQHGEEQRDERSWLALARPHEAAVGALLCARWSLPIALTEAVLRRDGAATQSGLGRLLWLVDELVEGLEAGLTLVELTGSPRLITLLPSAEARQRAMQQLEAVPALVAAFVEEGAGALQVCSSLVREQVTHVEGVWFVGALSRGRRGRLLLDADGKPRLLEGDGVKPGLEAVTLEAAEGPLTVWVRVAEPSLVEGRLRAGVTPFAVDGTLAVRLRQLAAHARRREDDDGRR